MTTTTDGPAESIAILRAKVFSEAANTDTAVLDPHDPGGIGPAERLAFAARVSRIDGIETTQGRYEARLAKSPISDDLIAIAQGRDPADPRLRAMAEHVDMLAAHPISARPDHIARLRQAGVCDADIVRLSELVSFIGYRARTDVALALLETAE